MSLTSPNLDPSLLERPNRPAASSFRWIILSLLVLATALNYLDRQILAVLGPKIQMYFKMSNEEWKAAYGHIQAAFAISYAIGQVVAGGWLDRIGTRIGYAASLVAWSVASVSHAFMRTALGLGISRSFLGVAESPNFPAATKTIAEWFPRRQRAYAMGWVNAGSNFGTILAPLVVLKLADSYGWQWAFIITSAGGMLWVMLWLPIYRKPAEHTRVSPAELALINSDPPEPVTAVPWITLLAYRQTWAFGVGKFFTDAVFWFFLAWTPQFFNDHYKIKISLTTIGPQLVIIAGMAAVGSITGGWLSSTMIRRGVGLNMARKMAMLVCAVCILPVAFVANVSSVWTAVFLLGWASAAHQGFSSNLYTLVSDTFPRRAVGSVAGLGGAMGWLGAALFTATTGHVLNWTHDNYTVLFVAASFCYLVPLGIIQLLSPSLEPVVIEDNSVTK